MLKLINCSLDDALYELKQAETGSHYIVVYPDTATIRKIYSAYTKAQLEDNNESVLILPFYETTYGVRTILNQTINVRKYEKEESLIIIDSLKAYFDSDIGLGLRSIAKRLLDYAIDSGKHGVSILGDMGSFCAFSNNTSKLLEYELSLPSKLKDIHLKGFCLYHYKDFDRFTQQQKQILLENHSKYLLIAPIIK